MKKIFIKIVEKVKKISFFRKTIHIVTGVAVYVDVKESVQVVLNASQPLPHRIVAGVRGSCCSIALITSYFGMAAPDPKVKVAFKVCCVFASSAYAISGGDTATALSLIYSSNRTTPTT